jgi:Protein of unknown function (DUF4019)
VNARLSINRRAWLRVLAVGALLAANVSFAQDPRAITAQRVARDWLALTDKADAAGSRDAAGAKFKEAVNVDNWADALAKARVPLGETEQRAVLSTKFDTTLPDGGPTGDFVLIIYRTSFAKKPESTETVTLERESDGNWRVIGYFIR